MSYRDEISNADIPQSIRITNDELSSVVQSISMIEEQASQLERGWRPALQELGRLKRQYDKVKRFSGAANLLLDMTEIRIQTPQLIAASEQVIRDVQGYLPHPP